jgi:NHL repeat
MRMRNGVVAAGLAVVLLAPAREPLLGSGASAEQAPLKVDMGDYEPVVPWPKPLPDTDLSHTGWTWGSGAGVWAESPDKVWVQQRGEIELPPGAPPWICGCLLNSRRTNTGRRDYSGTASGFQTRRHHILFAVDREGNTIQEWLQWDKYFAPPRGSGLGELGRGPHKVLMNPYDPQKRLWIVDDDMHEINVFSNDGTQKLKTMGVRGVPGRGPNNFNRPTDIAWLPDGTFFVADGYAGVRVAKFDPNGRFIKDWGRPPVDPASPKASEFWSVHSIGISRDRRVFVADRENHRMQVFDEDGNFLYMFPTGYNSSVLAHTVTDDDHVWVADWTTDRLVKYDLDGHYILDIGGHGPLPGQFDGVHQINVDSDRNLYVTEVANARSQKFRPKPNADPNRLVGMQARVSPVRTRRVAKP